MSSCIYYFAEAVEKYCDERVCVCVCVCVSAREHISETTRAIFTDFSELVAYRRGSVLLGQGRNPRGRGIFGRGCPGHSRAFSNLWWSRRVRVPCKRDHSIAIANNVTQQKESFSIPGKRKQNSGKLWAQAMRPIGREAGMGVHSAGEVWYLWLPCLELASEAWYGVGRYHGTIAAPRYHFGVCISTVDFTILFYSATLC